MSNPYQDLREWLRRLDRDAALNSALADQAYAMLGDHRGAIDQAAADGFASVRAVMGDEQADNIATFVLMAVSFILKCRET